MRSQDRKEIENHLKTIDTNNHNIIKNSNQQVIINKNFNETFTKTKESIAKDRENIILENNKIINYSYNLMHEIKYIDYSLKIKILSDNIESIQNNIAASRIGIIFTNFLTNDEIKEFKVDILKLKNIKLATLLDNFDNIIFVIMVPKDTINGHMYERC